MDSFNADFYVTTATIIPVLYLALTLQGTTFERIINYWKTVESRGQYFPANSKNGPLVPFFIAGYASIFFFISLLSEFFAVASLYYKKPYGSTILILWSVGGLLIMIAANPLIQFLARYLRLDEDPSSKKEPDKRARGGMVNSEEAPEDGTASSPVHPVGTDLDVEDQSNDSI